MISKMVRWATFLLWIQTMLYNTVSLSVNTATFSKEDAFLRVVGFEGALKVNFSLEFRTFQNNGVLLYHKLSSEGYIKIYLDKSEITANIQYLNTLPIKLQFNQVMSDGHWHKLDFFLDGESGILRLDNESLMSTLDRDIRTGSYYDIGGGLHGEVGYRGCIRNLVIDGKPREVETMEGMSAGCYLEDTCGCKNGGLCFKDECDCTGTQYDGTLCTVPLYPRTCTQAMELTAVSTAGSKIGSQQLLDIDGPGHLPPVEISCSLEGQEVITSIGHDNEDVTKVDGFQEPGSFQQNIHYQASWDFIQHLIDRSTYCTQYLRYDCKQSRLLDGSFGWWVNSNGKRELSWPSTMNQDISQAAAAAVTIGSCSCGLNNSCFDTGKLCNCDASADQWLSDEGFIKDKRLLPVSALFFGDTGTPFDNKEGRFSLGRLICSGDVEALSPIQILSAGDTVAPLAFEMDQIYFQFRSTEREGLMEIVSLSNDKTALLRVETDCLSTILINRKPIQTMTSRICNGRWHSVIIERSHLGLYVGLDYEKIWKDRTSIPRALLVNFGGQTGSQFIGGLRSLTIDNKPVDIRQLLVHSDRRDLCRSSPCLNGGICVKDGNSMYCDCTSVHKQGELCELDLGLSFAAEEYLTIDTRNYTLQSPIRSIQMSLSTDSRDGVIMSADTLKSNVFSLSVTRSGQLSLTYNSGRKYTVLVVQTVLRKERIHHLSIEFDERKRKVKVSDGDIEKVQSLAGDVGLLLDDVHLITLAGGISGCISALKIGDSNAFTMFNLRHESRTNHCGLEKRIRGTQSKYFSSLYSVEVVTNSLVLGLGVSLVVVLVSLIILGSIRYMRRQKGGYYTREDEGNVEATDPDSAVLNAVTGPKVERRREWIL